MTFVKPWISIIQNRYGYVVDLCSKVFWEGKKCGASQIDFVPSMTFWESLKFLLAGATFQASLIFPFAKQHRSISTFLICVMVEPGPGVVVSLCYEAVWHWEGWLHPRQNDVCDFRPKHFLFSFRATAYFLKLHNVVRFLPRDLYLENKDAGYT